MNLHFLRGRKFLLSAFAIAALATVAVIPASAIAPGMPRPAATGLYSGSVPGSYVLGVANTDSSDPFNDYGVEGYVPFDVGGVGVLGYTNAAKSYAVYGVTFGSNGIGVYGAGDGPTPAPNATPDSTHQSTGVVGDSKSGQGVFGSTEFPNASDPFAAPAAGVMGVDNTDNQLDNVGVAGESTSGYFGTFGVTSDGFAGAGGYGDTGVFGLNYDDGTNFPAAAGSFFGNYLAIYGSSDTAIGDTNITYPLILGDVNNSPVFEVDNSGNTYVEGELFLHNGQGTFSRTRNAAVSVKAFTPATTHPTTEDFGEGQLINGQAYIHLDPTFAQSIDDTTPYMVFVTPEGDTNGVFVTGKTLTGFAVRENKGGRSNVSFSYRIVAGQYGMTNRHIALVNTASIPGLRQHSSANAAFKAKLARFIQHRSSRPTLHLFRPSPNLAVERHIH